MLPTIPNDSALFLKRLRRPGRVKCCYEASPAGLGLQEALAGKGIDYVVVAPRWYRPPNVVKRPLAEAGAAGRSEIVVSSTTITV